MAGAPYSSEINIFYEKWKEKAPALVNRKGPVFMTMPGQFICNKKIEYSQLKIKKQKLLFLKFTDSKAKYLFEKGITKTIVRYWEKFTKLTEDFLNENDIVKVYLVYCLSYILGIETLNVSPLYIRERDLQNATVCTSLLQHNGILLYLRVIKQYWSSCYKITSGSDSKVGYKNTEYESSWPT